jgi:general secretion pathway protein B
MSFILDALRKSEAARRRSEAPDLFASMPQAPVPVQARPAWPLWALGVGGTLALVAALWLVNGRNADPSLSASPAPVGSPAGDADAVSSAPMPEPPPRPIPSAANQPAPTPLPPPANAPTMPAPIRTPPPASPVAAAPPLAAAPAPTLPSPATSAPPPAAPPMPAPAPVAPSASDRIATLAELDPQTRKQLPPLKISMHLWNDTASQRFVILDGQRLKEGDVLGDLVIERITRDGVVVAWRGGRLKLSR